MSKKYYTHSNLLQVVRMSKRSTYSLYNVRGLTLPPTACASPLCKLNYNSELYNTCRVTFAL